MICISSFNLFNFAGRIVKRPDQCMYMAQRAFVWLLNCPLVSEIHGNKICGPCCGPGVKRLSLCKSILIARFMGPTWGPSGADRTNVGPTLAPWTLLSGYGQVNLMWPLTSVPQVSEIRSWQDLGPLGPFLLSLLWFECKTTKQEHSYGQRASMGLLNNKR